MDGKTARQRLLMPSLMIITAGLLLGAAVGPNAPLTGSIGSVGADADGTAPAIQCPQPDQIALAEVGADTNVHCYPAKAVNYLASLPIGLQNLIGTNGFHNEVVFFGDTFEVGFTLAIASDVATPVDVTISPPQAETSYGAGSECKITDAEISIDDGSGTTMPLDQDRKVRLYPYLFADTDAGGVRTPSSVTVKIDGKAPSAPGYDFPELTCNIDTVVAAANGIAAQALVVPNMVTSLLPPITELALGSVIGTDGEDLSMVEAVGAELPAEIPMFGPGKSISFVLSVEAKFIEAANEAWDSDYMRVQWSPGSSHLVKTPDIRHIKTEVTMSDGDRITACVSGTIYDDEVLWFDDHEPLATDAFCQAFSYTQVADSEVFDNACQDVVDEQLAGRIPSPQQVTDCAGLKGSLGDEADGFIDQILAGTGNIVPVPEVGGIDGEKFRQTAYRVQERL